MALERTLSIIKPDAVKKNVIGQIVARFEKAGLRVVAARMKHLSRAEAEGFYAVHRERPFFRDLVEFMISGPVLIQVLEGDNAIAKNRELMGATDPRKADKGTIQDRKSTRLNSSHSQISYAVFCLKKKKRKQHTPLSATPESTSETPCQG